MGGFLRFAALLGIANAAAQADDFQLNARAEQILQLKCGTCHSGPFLDLRTPPFKWSETKDPKVFVAGMMARIRLQGWKKMPPVNAPSLTCEETLELENWAKGFDL